MARIQLTEIYRAKKGGGANTPNTKSILDAKPLTADVPAGAVAELARRKALKAAQMRRYRAKLKCPK